MSSTETSHVTIIPNIGERVRYNSDEKNPDRIKLGQLGTVVTGTAPEGHVDVLWDIIGKKTETPYSLLEIIPEDDVTETQEPDTISELDTGNGTE